MATREELLSLFGDDFDEVLKGLNALPVEVRQLLDRSLNNLVYDAEVFGQRINKVVQTQQARGIALSNIAGSLATDMQNKGRIFGELKNSIKSSLVEGVNQAGQAGSFAAYDPDENTIFTWITVAGHKICADCAPRGGQQGTLREWEERGMPGTGWSVCQGYCYCILDPSGKLSPRLTFEEVQEQGATARPKPAPPTKPLPKPPSTATTRSLKDSFVSENAHGNKHFVDAFTDSSDRFKSVVSKMPELRHIGTSRKGGYFAEFRTNEFTYKSKSDISYQTRHGGINVKYQTKSNSVAYNKEYGTIRHEYGHFMHHNLHPNIGKMDRVYDDYQKALKNGDVVSVNDYVKKRKVVAGIKMDKAATDQLKFHEAYLTDRHNLGVGSKYKRTTKAMKETYQEKRAMYRELYEMELNPIVEYSGTNPIRLRERGGLFFTEDSAIVKALLDDKNNTGLYFQDLLGGITNNKIGHGHSTAYLARPTFARHEVFANLTALYSHQNPLIWEYTKQNLPALCKYYEDVIETILKDGYFGIEIN